MEKYVETNKIYFHAESSVSLYYFLCVWITERKKKKLSLILRLYTTVCSVENAIQKISQVHFVCAFHTEIHEEFLRYLFDNTSLQFTWTTHRHGFDPFSARLTKQFLFPAILFEWIFSARIISANWLISEKL